MKAHRRIILREAAMGAGLLTAAWYLYYLVGAGAVMDYLRDGPMLEYMTGPAIHIEMLVSGLGLGVMLALVGYLSEGTTLRLRPFGQIILIKSALYLAGLAIVAVVVNLIFLAFVYSWEELRAVWSTMSPRLVAGLGLWMVLSMVGRVQAARSCEDSPRDISCDELSDNPCGPGVQ